MMKLRELPEGSSLDPTSTSRFPVYTRISRSADLRSAWEALFQPVCRLILESAYTADQR